MSRFRTTPTSTPTLITSRTSTTSRSAGRSSATGRGSPTIPSCCRASRSVRTPWSAQWGSRRSPSPPASSPVESRRGRSARRRATRSHNRGVLRRLTVRNLAIVEDLDLELGPGLTVVTGETGAGKSILVDALALLAGARGSSDLVRQGGERLVVAGEFDCDRGIRELLEEAGLPSDGDALLVRRELATDGRGRAF